MDEYTVTFDDTTGEYTATAGDDSYTVPSVHLAYLWLAQQIESGGDDE
jgi:hypothetical protein